MASAATGVPAVGAVRPTGRKSAGGGGGRIGTWRPAHAARAAAVRGLRRDRRPAVRRPARRGPGTISDHAGHRPAGHVDRHAGVGGGQGLGVAGGFRRVRRRAARGCPRCGPAGVRWVPRAPSVPSCGSPDRKASAVPPGSRASALLRRRLLGRAGPNGTGRLRERRSPRGCGCREASGVPLPGRPRNARACWAPSGMKTDAGRPAGPRAGSTRPVGASAMGGGGGSESRPRSMAAPAKPVAFPVPPTPPTPPVGEPSGRRWSDTKIADQEDDPRAPAAFRPWCLWTSRAFQAWVAEPSKEPADSTRRGLVLSDGTRYRTKKFRSACPKGSMAWLLGSRAALVRLGYTAPGPAAVAGPFLSVKSDVCRGQNRSETRSRVVFRVFDRASNLPKRLERCPPMTTPRRRRLRRWTGSDLELLISMKMYVGNLAWRTTTEDLEALFSNYGSVSDAIVLTDRETGRSRGFGFVTMGDEDAKKAIDALDGSDFEGRPAPRQRGAGACSPRWRWRRWWWLRRRQPWRRRRWQPRWRWRWRRRQPLVTPTGLARERPSETRRGGLRPARFCVRGVRVPRGSGSGGRGRRMRHARVASATNPRPGGVRWSVSAVAPARG